MLIATVGVILPNGTPELFTLKECMGFYLWLDKDLAWAQGTYEYRPLGTAVIAVSDLFRQRDFDCRRKLSVSAEASYLGHFASLGHMNAELRSQRLPLRRSST
ncbi:MAG TPA: hypothetical protein VJ732_17245 [Bryobacteraceae bacterium]|nr:hypothetical protein [Bryobacteraceae bacterium]